MISAYFLESPDKCRNMHKCAGWVAALPLAHLIERQPLVNLTLGDL